MASSTKDRLVSAGANRFQDLGYSACSVQDIVDLAGVPKGSFYNHFKTKEAFAVEVVTNYIASTRRDILADKTLSAYDRISKHFQHLVESYQETGYSRGCLIVNLTAESSEQIPDLRDALIDTLQTWIELLAETIAEGQQSGEIKKEIDPEKLSRFLINCYEGSVLRMKLMRSKAPLEDFYSIGMSLLKDD